MPLPPVVIELSAVDAASEHAGALVAACSESVVDGDCVLGGGAKRPAEARAVAIVSWPDSTTGHIELGVRRESRVRWIVRDLRFGGDDPPAERWRSVGLVIGTLVGEAEASARVEQLPAPPPAAPRPTTHVLAAEPPAPEAVATRAWIGLDAVAGPALDDGSWRFGGGPTVAVDGPLGPLAIVASARYALRPRSDSVSVDVLALAAGVAARARLGPSIEVELGGAGLAERLHASAEAPDRSDAGARWISGARGRLGVGVLPERRWRLVLGGEVEWRAGATTIRVGGRRVGDFPTLTYSLTLGASFQAF